MDQAKGEQPLDHLSVGRTQDRTVRLRYRRVVQADCDLHKEMTECWQSVKAKLALNSASTPICFGYEGISDHYDSMVAYPVEVWLFTQPVVKISSGPVKCWPVD